jgi:hypothetical protein
MEATKTTAYPSQLATRSGCAIPVATGWDRIRLCAMMRVDVVRSPYCRNASFQQAAPPSELRDRGVVSDTEPPPFESHTARHRRWCRCYGGCGASRWMMEMPPRSGGPTPLVPNENRESAGTLHHGADVSSNRSASNTCRYRSVPSALPTTPDFVCSLAREHSQPA